jgi:hypothetical protein
VNPLLKSTGRNIVGGSFGFGFIGLVFLAGSVAALRNSGLGNGTCMKVMDGDVVRWREGR